MYTEVDACQPIPVEVSAFNEEAVLPYGLTVSHLQDFISFLGFLNQQLYSGASQIFCGTRLTSVGISLVNESVPLGGQ